MSKMKQQQTKAFLEMLLLYKKRKFFKTKKHCIKVYNIFLNYCNLFGKEFKYTEFDVFLDKDNYFEIKEILDMLIMIIKKVEFENMQVFYNLILLIVGICRISWEYGGSIIGNIWKVKKDERI